jgi:hypothetical protein
LATQGSPDKQASNRETQASADASVASPSVVANSPAVVDNGLWEGASVGPCCSQCGGGNAPPPDWYTLQGVRILSRSMPRKDTLVRESPSTGTYTAMPDQAGDYHVYNNVSAYVTYPSGSIGVPVTATTEVLNTKQIGLGASAGYNLTLGHYFCRDRNNNDHFIEFTFWGFNSWSSSKTINGQPVPIYDEDETYSAAQASLINFGEMVPTQTSPAKYRGSLRTGFPMATSTELDGAATPQQKTLSLAFNNGTQDDLSYGSTMNNFEINGRFCQRGVADRLVLHPDGQWRRECEPGTYMSYLYGVRFMQINETFKFHSISQGQYGEDWTLATQDAVGDYDVVAHNSLLGLQVGADMMFRKCRWAWGIEAKIGPYINFNDQTSLIDAVVTDGTSHPSYSNRLSDSACTAALIGEIGFQATYKFRPNLMGRAAYDFMWISGVALAPEQLQFVSGPVNKVNSNGSIFSEGVSFGLEWMW